MTYDRRDSTVAMMITFYVEKRHWFTNIVTGASSARSFWPSEGRAYPYVTDAEAVRHDWLVVGDDLRDAITQKLSED